MLDYMRCAALRNEILECGWLGSEHEREELPTQNWFIYHHGADAEAVKSRLSPDRKAFLELTIQVSDAEQLSLYYDANGLRYPEILWTNYEGFADDGDRFITLYSSNLDSKPNGLL